MRNTKNKKKNLLPLKRIYWKLKHLSPTEQERFFDTYGNIARHTPTILKFRDIKIETPDATSVLFHISDFFIDRGFGELNPESSLIIDCGSNVGASVLSFRKLCPMARIIAFEPDPVIFEYLKKNTLNVPRVELYNKAVWIKDETVYFTQDNADGGYINTKGIPVPAIRLKTVLEKYKHIDFLKIDIEGAEVEVLEDCKNSLSHVEKIYVEYHDQHQKKGQRLDRVLSILTGAGFLYDLNTEFGGPLQVNIRASRNKL